MKYTLKSEIFPILILLAAWVLGFYFYSMFPDTVVTHWNFEGTPDGYSGKALGSFLMPAVLTGMYLLFLALPLIDPKKDRYESFMRVYHIFKSLIIAVMFTIHVVTGLFNLGYDIPINLVIPLLIGLLFIVMGNYMGKVKQNWFLGVRLPWTLSSENVWNKSNRFGGWTMALCGILIMISPFLPRSWGFSIFIFGILLIIFGTTIYSYLVYRKELREGKEI